ncbi:transposase [Tolypothrix sp. VBCCA 56010]|uniref:transposase n=1 Tax=Tolypothrix sp. VBCCA 56010 TaxID=3137731 RepID=UPI003D7CEA11
MIWNGAPYHRSQIVLDAAAALDMKVEPLPSYSPDFMPVEHLWQWLRSDVTYHTCYLAQSDLIEQVSAFEQRINACPNTVADRSVGYNSSQT